MNTLLKKTTMRPVKQLLNISMVGKKGMFLCCLNDRGEVFVYEPKKEIWTKIMKTLNEINE